MKEPQNRREKRAMKQKKESNYYYSIPYALKQRGIQKCFKPEEKPSAHGKSLVLIDNENSKSLKEVVENFPRNPINEVTFYNSRDKNHESILDVLRKIGKITFCEDDKKDSCSIRELGFGFYQIDVYSSSTAKSKKGNNDNWNYEISFVINLEKYPCQIISIIAFSKEGYDEINKESLRESLMGIRVWLLVSAWAISYLSLEPRKCDGYIYPEVTIPEGWFK